MALYCHYECRNLTADISVIKFCFSSSSDERAGKGSTFISKSDYEHCKQILPIIKQIPSGQRTYDPVTKIWSIPINKLPMLTALMASQGYADTMIDHTLRGGLDAWFRVDANGDATSHKKPPAWHQQVMGSGRVKVEAAEDFFKNNISNSAVVMPMQELEMQLRTIILGVMPSLTLQSKEEFLRGYKLAARKLHPDMNNGDGSRMSELNSLWSQYREVAK